MVIPTVDDVMLIISSVGKTICGPLEIAVTVFFADPIILHVAVRLVHNKLSALTVEDIYFITILFYSVFI